MIALFCSVLFYVNPSEESMLLWEGGESMSNLDFVGSSSAALSSQGGRLNSKLLIPTPCGDPGCLSLSSGQNKVGEFLRLN